MVSIKRNFLLSNSTLGVFVENTTVLYHEVCIPSVGCSGYWVVITRPTHPIPATITEALTVSKGTYSAHFKKQPGKNL